ncbi:MAG TPA: TIGR01906 family membrane protein [Anaerolineales bacterium]|nr:TIGR01906 family membrane protein [Anaerolineales bacterium]
MKLSFLSWLVTVLVPLVLIGLAIRVLLSPIFYRLEYSMPYFPPDEYGFTKEDRLKWAPYAVNYLVNDADTSYLGDLTFEDGSPLYNDRELRHMDDVKRITQGALRVWYGSLVLILALGVWAWFGGWWQAYLLGLKRGGWLIVGLAVTIGLIVFIGIAVNPNVFNSFFVAFHSLFFEGDSWLFLYSDTLIRLFPLRFWQDAFLWAAAIALGGGVALALGIKPKL